MRMSMQIVILCASAALVAAQVPRKAFRFRPNHVPAFRPGASFVELDDAAFIRLRRQVLASSTGPRHWNEGASERDIDAFALEETMPPPSPMPMDEGFVRADFSGVDIAVKSREPIRPPSFSANVVPPPPPDAADPVRPSADLLDLDYPSLSQ